MKRALSSDMAYFEDYVKRRIAEIDWAMAERLDRVLRSIESQGERIDKLERFVKTILDTPQNKKHLTVIKSKKAPDEYSLVIDDEEDIRKVEEISRILNVSKDQAVRMVIHWMLLSSIADKNY